MKFLHCIFITILRIKNIIIVNLINIVNLGNPLIK